MSRNKCRFYCNIAHALHILYQETSLPISFICSFIKAFSVWHLQRIKLSKSFSVYNLRFVKIPDGDNFIFVQSYVICLFCHLDRIFHDKCCQDCYLTSRIFFNKISCHHFTSVSDFNKMIQKYIASVLMSAFCHCTVHRRGLIWRWCNLHWLVGPYYNQGKVHAFLTVLFKLLCG